MTGIYKITETETGKCYIGQSVCIERRFKEHHKRWPLDSHTYEVLMECNDNVSNFFEKAFISGYDCLEPKGLNKTIGGRGLLNVSKKGRPLSTEHRAKLSAAMKGNTNSKGQTFSEEWHRKQSESRKGIKRGPYKKKEA